jgi:hypothetical protein
LFRFFRCFGKNGLLAGWREITEGMANNVTSIFTWRSKLLAFYEEHDPSKIQNVDNILVKYFGREIHLLDFLRKKYNVKASFHSEMLDFSSSKFDPLLALNAAKVVPPVTNAQPLDNINKARILVCFSENWIYLIGTVAPRLMP